MDESKPSRARSVLASVAAVMTVVAVIGVTNALTSNGTGTSFVTPDPPAPVATRLVGFGRAAIAVPKVWGTNRSRCGTPRKDTVLIDDPSAASDCQLPRPAKVESVELKSTPSIYPAGMIVGVSPAPGSLLKLGSTVTVTVVS